MTLKRLFFYFLLSTSWLLGYNYHFDVYCPKGARLPSILVDKENFYLSQEGGLIVSLGNSYEGCYLPQEQLFFDTEGNHMPHSALGGIRVTCSLWIENEKQNLDNFIFAQVVPEDDTGSTLTLHFKDDTVIEKNTKIRAPGTLSLKAKSKSITNKGTLETQEGSIHIQARHFENSGGTLSSPQGQLKFSPLI